MQAKQCPAGFSPKIAILSFWLSVMVVWRHVALPAFPWVPEALTVLEKASYVAYGTVPAFCFISGFLFFRSYRPEDYVTKLRKRLRTLLVPYLVWNALCGLGWYLAGRYLPVGCVLDVKRFGSVADVLAGVFLSEYSILWYVGVIIVFALGAPLIYNMVRRPRLGVALILLFSAVNLVRHFPDQGPLPWLPVYMCGAWAAIHRPDFMFRPQPGWVTMAGIAAFAASYACLVAWGSPEALYLLRLSAPFAMIGAYDLIGRIVTFGMHGIYRYAFMIYAMHFIPLHVTKNYLTLYPGQAHAWVCWLTYLVLPVLVVVMCLMLSALVRRHLPRLYAVLSGDR